MSSQTYTKVQLDTLLGSKVDVGTLAEQVQDIVGAFIKAGSNVTVSYDDAGNGFTINAIGGGTGGSTDPEVVRDTIGAALVAGANLQILVNDPGDTITVNVVGLASVATSGAYGSLTGTPDLTTKVDVLTATTVKTAAYTAAVGNLIPADATTAGFTVTLPTAPADRSRVTVKKIDATANVVTIATAGSDVFNKVGGSTSLNLSVSNQAATFQYAASSGVWYLVGSDLPLTQLDTRYALSSTNTGDQTLSVAGTTLTIGGANGNSVTLPTTATSTVTTPPAVARLYAAIARRHFTPCTIVFCGDSITVGQGANADGNRWVNALTTALQAKYPRAGATDRAVQTLSVAPNDSGIQGYNAGISGSTSATYLPDATIAQIVPVAPKVVFHTVGTNDAWSTAPATYGSNITARIAALNTALGYTPLHVLVHILPKASSGTYTWDQYGAQMKAIADNDPSNVVYVDEAPYFAKVGVPGNNSYGLLGPDAVHPTDAGHALVADLALAGVNLHGFPGPTFAGVAPVAISTAPAITGTTQVGQVLSVSDGTWASSIMVGGYQWKRNGFPIIGATSNTYTLVAADAGQPITATVRAEKFGYIPGFATSNSVTPTNPGSTLTNSTAPAVTPTTGVTTGTVLTSTTGTWSATPDSYTYQWNRAGTPISGATSSTYTIVTADLTNAITCTVTAIKASYTSGVATSNAVTPTGGSNTAPGAPTGLTATPGNAQVSLSWTAPASNGGAAITDYIIEYQPAGGSFAVFSDGTSTTTTTIVTGLTNGTVYTFRVSAVNTVGTGTPSATATATPAAPTGVGPTLTPTGTPIYSTGQIGNAYNPNGGKLAWTGASFGPASFPTPGTLEAWVNNTGDATSVKYAVMAGADNNNYFSLGIAANGKPQFQYSSFIYSSGPTVLGTGWHHLAISDDNTNLYFFLDGVQQYVTAQGGLQASYTAFTIGRKNDDTGQWVGLIDEVRLSKVARYTAAFTPSTTAFVADANTLALYHLDS